MRRSDKNLIHHHPPSRHGRLGIGDLASPEDDGLVGRIRVIDADAKVERVDVPDDRRAGLEMTEDPPAIAFCNILP